ncbi:DNA cytosine methyltransferase [soil metagenome]
MPRAAQNPSSSARRPIGIDLFAGAGGMSLGFEQAGFDVRAAVEIDPIHAAIHHFNFPMCALLPHSVRDLSAMHIREAAGIGRAPVEVVFGGAPCQGFSLIGQRVLDDPRNSLVRDFVRLVSELDARYFVFENVKGLTVGQHRAFLDELIATFKTHGYAVRTPWLVLNAAAYGVPQDRQRLFLLGAKDDHPLPNYPMPTTVPAGRLPDLGLPAGPSGRDALDDLPDAESFTTLLDNDSVRTVAWGTPSAYAREMRCLDRDSWHFGYRRKWDRDTLTGSIRTVHTDISRSRFANTMPGSVEPVSRFFKLPSDGVSNTLRAGTDASRGAFTSPRPIHYRHHRCITVREMARLHGFPDWFRLHRTKWHGARQIGNAVPPPLARAVAGAVAMAMGYHPLRPGEVLTLGNPAVLNMDMSCAASFWGIHNPIGRRDQKSGAKKRSQAQVEEDRLAAKHGGGIRMRTRVFKPQRGGPKPAQGNARATPWGAR